MIRLPVHQRQAQLLAAIAELRDRDGVLPTQRELARHLGISLTRVAQLVTACEASGQLTRRPKCARTYCIASDPA
jgi:DNA-binding MarR family transcriptional regulator